MLIYIIFNRSAPKSFISASSYSHDIEPKTRQFLEDWCCPLANHNEGMTSNKSNSWTSAMDFNTISFLEDWCFPSDANANLTPSDVRLFSHEELTSSFGIMESEGNFKDQECQTE